MKEKIDTILRDSSKLIQSKEQKIINILKDVPEVISLLETAFENLKAVVSDYTFETMSDEINFFKESKPQLFCKLIYYRKVYNIEMRRPTSSLGTQKKYLEQEQDHIRMYFDKNMEFIHYHRSNNTLLDEYYFVRGKHDIELYLESFYFERDPRFSTNFDFKLAKLLANDMLAVYLNHELIKLQQNHNQQFSIDFSPKGADKWTDLKTALAEMIYGIHTLRSVNHGNIDIKVLTAHFEKIFNVELGDVYRIFLEIRGRKGDRTIYLNRMIEALNKRMDDADNK